MPATTYEQYTGTGEAIPDEQDTRNHLPLKPRKIRSPFTLCHIPSRWQWNAEDGWYPDLSKITHKAGCNGVEALGSGPGASINPLPSIAAHQAVKGASIINRKDPRVPGGDYLVRHLCRNGQYHHTLKFVSWSRVGNGRLRKRFDKAGHMAWLRELEAAGFIAPMSAEVLEDKLEILEKRINRYQNDRAGNVGVQVSLERAVTQRDAMAADWSKQYGPDAGKKAPKKKGKK